MKKYEHLKRKAIELREKGKSLNDIMAMLKMNRSTIYYWIKDISLPDNYEVKHNAIAGAKAVREKYAKLRKEAYNQAFGEAEKILKNPSFRDFIVMYMGEGYKKSRNTVSICNSDPKIIELSNKWIQEYAINKITYRIQYHVDQDLNKLKIFWSNIVDCNPNDIKMQRKSNSGKLSGRNWRSEYGVLTIRTNDTYFRSKLQAWMDYIKKSW